MALFKEGSWKDLEFHGPSAKYTINFIMDLLEWVLKNNHTTFNNKIYLQIKALQ
jgi:hypothetical protein